MSLPHLRIRYADVAATLALVLAGSGTAYAVAALPDGSVTTAAIKDGAVTTPKLHGSAVSTPKLAPLAVTSDRLADGAVTNPKLANHSITSGKFVTGSVGTAAVAGDSLTLADLAGVDVSGAVSLSFAANACSNVTLGVGGAQVGQVALFAWTGTSNPASLMTGPPRVSAANTVVVPMCNPSSSPVSVSDQPVRIVTFD